MMFDGTDATALEPFIGECVCEYELGKEEDISVSE